MTAPSDAPGAGGGPAGALDVAAEWRGDEAERRLHPLGIAFRAGALLRNAALALLAAAFAGSLRWVLWMWPFFAASLAAEAAAHLRTRYRLADDGLVIEEGLLGRRVRTIPYDRVQNIDTVQNVAHRLFGVAEVRIETAGGAGAEARLTVLALPEVERLRRCVAQRQATAASDAAPSAVGAGGDGPPTAAAAATAASTAASITPSAAAPAPTPAPIVRLGVGELVLHGLTRGQRATLLFAGLGLAWNAVEVLGLGDRWLAGWSPGDVVGAYGPLFRLGFDDAGQIARAVLLGLVALAGLALVLTALGALWSTAQLWDFTMTRAGDDLRVSHGLFTRRVATVPRGRIQSVAVWDTPFTRRLGRVAVSVETAGGGGPAGGEAVRTWLAPIWPRDRLPALLAEAVPGLDLDAFAWRPVHPGAAARLRRRGLAEGAVLAILAAALGSAAGPRAAAALGLATLAAGGGWALLSAPRDAAARGYARHGGAFAVRHGWWRRTWAVARVERIQSVTLAASPFDRRAGMAAVRVDTAGRTDGAHALAAGYLARADAEALRDALSAGSAGA